MLIVCGIDASLLDVILFTQCSCCSCAIGILSRKKHCPDQWHKVFCSNSFGCYIYVFDPSFSWFLCRVKKNGVAFLIAVTKCWARSNAKEEEIFLCSSLRKDTVNHGGEGKGSWQECEGTPVHSREVEGRLEKLNFQWASAGFQSSVPKKGPSIQTLSL